MRLLILATLVYAIFGCAIVFLFRGDPFSILASMVATATAMFIYTFAAKGLYFVPVAALSLFFITRNQLAVRISNTVAAAIACSAIAVIFTMVKSTLPFVLPFWADPIFAEIDQFMHLGVDPWVLTHKFSSLVGTDFMATYYYGLWVLPAMSFPALISIADGDDSRVKRFVVLWLFVLIGLGNVFALTFLSAGPVYYDRLFEEPRFTELMTSLVNLRVIDSGVGGLMELLWDSYESKIPLSGSGISAFPSVHVAMAAVVSLYLVERHRFFIAPAIVIVSLYQFFSVYQGWHYAVDGYFSIIATVFVWRFLKSRQEKQVRHTPEPTLRSQVL